jgi:hypothetical protein
VVLGAAILLVSCGSGAAEHPAATRSLRSVTPVDLLNHVALDADVCTLLPPDPDEEGKLTGNIDHAGQTYFAVVGGTTNGSNVHVAIDRFSSAAAAARASALAAPAIPLMLGTGTKASTALPGWPGSRTYIRRITDYTGKPRVAFGATLPAGRAVVRINSLGLPAVQSEAQFRALSLRLLDGLTGRAGVRSIPPCS